MRQPDLGEDLPVAEGADPAVFAPRSVTFVGPLASTLVAQRTGWGRGVARHSQDKVARMRAFLRLGWLCAALALTAGMVTAQATPSLAGAITFLQDPLEGNVAVGGDLSVKAGDRVQLVINYQDDSSYYLLDIAVPKACFYKVAGGTTKAIGVPGELNVPNPAAAQKFSILRKDYRLIFVLEGQVVCRGWDGALANGKAGYVAAEGQVVNPFVQPMARIESSDNFMRDQDAQHMWTEFSGTWEIESLRDDDQAEAMEADKSANAFSYQAVGRDGPAISVAEKDLWFWTNYRMEASARSVGDGAMGLVLLAQDGANYLAFRWASAWDDGARGNRAELLEVVAGQPKVLAEKAGGFVPDQWYKLSAAVCDGQIECAIDDIPVLEGFCDHFGQGNAGLYAEGEARTYFDDVSIEDYETFREDFANLVRWDPASGEWSVTNAGEAQCVKGGLLTTGRLGWSGYRVEATATPNRAQVGLEVARQADGRAVLYRIDPAAGKAQLLAVGPEGEKLLAEREVKVNGGKGLRLAATVEQGFVKAYLNGEPTVEGFAADCPAGGIGLYAQGEKETHFDDVCVAFLGPKHAAQVTREFTKVSEHPEMAEWASSRAPWVQPAEMKPGATWWTKGDYYGDATVAFKVRFIGLRDGTVKVTLNGEPERPDQGVHLVLTAVKGSRLLKAQVLDGTAEVAQGQVELASSSCSVRFAREGAHVMVFVDDKPLIEREL